MGSRTTNDGAPDPQIVEAWNSPALTDADALADLVGEPRPDHPAQAEAQA